MESLDAIISGCHCIPTTNGLFIISIASIMPSGDIAVFLKLGATYLTAWWWALLTI